MANVQGNASEHHATIETQLKTCLDNGLLVRISIEIDAGALPAFASVPKMAAVALQASINPKLVRMIIAGTSATKRSEIEMSLKSAHSAIIASEGTKKRQRELEHERKQAQAALSEQAPPPPTRQRTSGWFVNPFSGSSSAE